MSQAFLLVEKLVLHHPEPINYYKKYIFYTCIRYLDYITHKNRVVCVKGYYPSFDKNTFYTCLKRDEDPYTVLWERFEGELYFI